MLGYFLRKLTSALSDEKYIKKLQEDQKLYLYEDLKKTHLFILDIDLINDVFSKCEAQLLKDTHKLPENSEIPGFKDYKDIMEMTLVSFHESNYLSKNNDDSDMSLHEEYSSNLSHNPQYQDHTGLISVSNISQESFVNTKNTLVRLLRLFTLIYQQKFIFGDLRSKSPSLEFN
ncbi:hypothetical protein RF11_15396 [Thelohanellus kitauei]|uniref:Uncharacterized protein n=1 Tax=Thelohanellus kitauei TaxID=669202 RepID=A0A0C2MPW6_THEKT|nr:hypothetical protein RF11_15396 [Thelohanellus kitauei]